MKRSVLCLLLLILSVLPGRLSALLVPRLTFIDLARQSDTVLRGRLADTHTRLTPDGKWILTDYIYSVSRCYRMTTESCPSKIVVTLPGGKIGDRSQQIPGTPDLRQIDGEVILFLSQKVPTGISQGILQIKGGTVFGPPLNEVAPQGMPLADFERELPRLLTSVLHGGCSSLLCPPPPSQPPPVT